MSAHPMAMTHFDNSVDHNIYDTEKIVHDSYPANTIYRYESLFKSTNSISISPIELQNSFLPYTEQRFQSTNNIYIAINYEKINIYDTMNNAGQVQTCLNDNHLNSKNIDTTKLLIKYNKSLRDFITIFAATILVALLATFLNVHLITTQFAAVLLFFCGTYYYMVAYAEKN